MKSMLNKQTDTKPSAQRSSFKGTASTKRPNLRLICSDRGCSHSSEPGLLPEGFPSLEGAPGARDGPAGLGRGCEEFTEPFPSPALPGTGS